MNKRMAFSLIMAAVTAVLLYVLQVNVSDFIAHQNRIEIYTSDGSYMLTDNLSVFSALELKSSFSEDGSCEIRDFHDAQAVISQFKKLTVFTVSLCASFMLLRYAYLDILNTSKRLKGELAYTSLSSYVGENSVDVLTLLIKYVIIVLVAIFLYINFRFEVYIPARVLPSEYILDFTHYKALVQNSSRAESLYPKSHFELLYEATFRKSVVLCLAITCSSFFTFVGANNYFVRWRRDKA